MELYGEVRDQYLDFATYAEGESACFTDWARAVADDNEVLAWIAGLPPIKQQPNLVFAAARWHGVPAPGPYVGLRAALLADGEGGAIRETILARATQTNEAGRLATLTPVFALLAERHGPLALLEVGASAGLCLYPDRYDYSWPPLGELRGHARDTLTAAVEGPMPVPRRPVEVGWRGGIDLHPLDVTDSRPDGDMAWLTNLVWPEQDDRREQLRRAIEVARADPPRLVEGDLIEQLPALLEEAAGHGTPVVFHTAVIAYLDEPRRVEFGALMADLVAAGRCHWVSNEAPTVLPGLVTGAPVPARMALALDGLQHAWAHPHGRALTWL